LFPRSSRLAVGPRDGAAAGQIEYVPLRGYAVVEALAGMDKIEAFLVIEGENVMGGSD